MKYKIIPVETIKNLIEFLDEIQFDAAKNQTPDITKKILKKVLRRTRKI